jgi:hypothetical protein
MHFNSPFYKPNPFKAGQHTTNLIYESKTDRHLSSRAVNSTLFKIESRVIRDNNQNIYNAEFIDLSMREPGTSKL